MFKRIHVSLSYEELYLGTFIVKFINPLWFLIQELPLKHQEMYLGIIILLSSIFELILLELPERGRERNKGKGNYQN
jgi:hypothetical protein